MSNPSPSRASAAKAATPVPLDRYECTFVVDIKGHGDFTALQPAIAKLPATGGKIFVKAGVYPLTSTIQISQSNIHIQGEGMGITIFTADNTMTGDTPALEVHNSVVGTARPLVADTARGDTSVTISPADAASFNVGDYVLLFSDKEIDTEHTAKHAGEVKQIITVDSVSGIIAFDDQIFDAYALADAAQLVRITMLQNITLSDFSITTNATSSTLKRGFTHFRFVENLQIQRIEVHDAYNTGIHPQSVRNAKISDCYVHHINDINPPANEHYGIVVGGASQNVSISGCRFSHTRHAVTTGSTSGQFENGVQRNIVVANCTSMLTDTAHFDTHQPVENITFVGCVAIGGMPASSEAYGFQMRGRNCSIVGCSVLQAIGRGIMLFGPVSSGALVVGNMIANVKAINGRNGVGIYLAGPETPDWPGTSNHTINGNVIKNCDGSGIGNGGLNNDIVISGNVIENTNSVVPAAAIQLTDAARILITGNSVTETAMNPAIAMAGRSDNWQIVQNSLRGTGPNAVSLSRNGSAVVNNSGYNPVGNITNPWPTHGAELTNNVTAGNASPQSGTSYTVRHTAKTIVVTGGSVSQIAINGINSGLTAGAFKLGLGETIAVTYDMLAPTTAVFAE